MKTLFLKIDNQGLHYNPQQYIAWADTNLPAGDFSFRTKDPIYWRCQMIAYQADQQTLLLEVVDYEVDYEVRFETQNPKSPVRRIELKPLREKTFKALLSYYKPESISRICASDQEVEESMPSRVTIDWGEPTADYSTRIPPVVVAVEEAFKKTQDETIPLVFSTSIMEAQFGLGLVTVYAWCIELEEEVSLPVYNDFIIPEFDYIKPYFAKVLKQRKFAVSGEIVLEGGKIVSRSAKAPAIEKIDEDFLALVRAANLKALLQKPKVEVLDKSLFTADEMFNTFSEEKEDLGNVYGTPDEDLIKQIMELRKVRNVKQLHYLAGKLHDSDERIRFTLSPLFGFIFIVKGERSNHFIWELLNSHATYIWSYEQDGSTLERQFRALEKILQFIRTNGRQEYRNNHHLMTEGFLFHPIRHRDANSKLVDGFPRWRNLLLEKLV